MAKKSQRGTVYQIPLEGNFLGYGITLESLYAAFFDIRTKQPVPLEQVVSHKILFICAVAHDAIKKWEPIGKSEEHAKNIRIPKYFHQDGHDSEEIYIVHAPGNKRVPAAYEEVRDLERNIIWLEGQIERRLEDYFEGKPHKFLERVRPVDPASGETRVERLRRKSREKLEAEKTGVDPFANDASHDWFAELTETEDPVSLIKESISKLLEDVENGASLDADTCNRVIAASGVLAYGRGMHPEMMPPQGARWVRSNTIIFDFTSAVLYRRAERALIEVMENDDSELRELWSTSGDLGGWGRKIEKLKTYLEPKSTDKEKVAAEQAGVDLFENDDSHDWLIELEETDHPVDFIEETFSNLLKEAANGAYLDVDFCNRVVASAGILAVGRGLLPEELPTRGTSWVKDNASSFDSTSADLYRKAERALSTVMESENSELRELWRESGLFPDWKQKMERLKSHLRTSS